MKNDMTSNLIYLSSRKILLFLALVLSSKTNAVGDNGCKVPSNYWGGVIYLLVVKQMCFDLDENANTGLYFDGKIQLGGPSSNSRP